MTQLKCNLVSEEPNGCLILYLKTGKQKTKKRLQIIAKYYRKHEKLTWDFFFYYFNEFIFLCNKKA